MDFLNFDSVENVPGFEARVAFTVNSATVFKEDVDIVPTIVDETLSYIPWGGDNQLPFNVIDLIEKDETLATCQVFNAEVCFGSGLHYDTCLATQTDFARPRRLVSIGLSAPCGSSNSCRLADIVNHIRQNADDFSEWYNSETAKLFAPPLFRNKKNAAGYFF